MKQKNSLEKAWFILSPLLFYMVAKNIAAVFFLMVLQTVREQPAITQALPVLGEKQLCAAVVNGITSLIGVSFLYRRFLEETTFRGEYDPDASVWKQTLMRFQTSIATHKGKILSFLLVPVYAGVIAVLLNLLMSFLPITSREYGRVAGIQYSVPVWLGVILYGIIAPVAEEIVFRGMIYNRMKRHFSLTVSILLTSIMFGAFHGNMVQMIYATVLGILMCVTYERLGSFWGPLFFHMSANITVYLCAAI